VNLAEFSIKKNVITWALTAVLLFAGLSAFNNLSRLEDPEFTIKDALITTQYPGATAEEVESEVTDLIERAVQELGQLKRVESTSSRGVSVVKATIHDKYDKSSLPQVWDELRRKVNDAQGKLPPGAGPSIVNDDYGDVYGVYAAITGKGYSYRDLYEFAKLLRRELLLAQDVKKIVIWGQQQETIYVEMSRTKMAALGISQDDIYSALASKNLVTDAGRLRIGPEHIPIDPTGEFESEQEFGDLLISSRESDRLVYLSDVATIVRGYEEPPRKLMRFNGQPAVALGISTILGGNVVEMGEAIEKKMKAMASQIPAGMDINMIAHQSQAVTEAINSFVVNLVEAVVIVVVVLLFFMGLRSGLIIGGILFLTISGTFLVMAFYQITLERISLGALIIALGMLVDNAIVVVDGMKVRIESGMERLKAAKEVVGQQTFPLFGATVVAITAFAAIGTSQDSTGEYCRSLFTVILIALGLSWVTAVTTTPLVSYLFLPGPKKAKGGVETDPYGGLLFRGYKAFLVLCLKARYVVVAVVFGLFVASIFGFGYVKNMFFPDSTRAQFFVEFYFAEGTDIRETAAQMEKAEEYLMGLDHVTGVGTAVGGSDLRFLLTYTPIPGSPGNAVIFAEVDDWTLINGMVPMVQNDLEALLPGGTVAVKKFRLGPGEGGRIQIRISGSDRTVLREMGSDVERILREAGAIAVRNEWKEKVMVVRPVLAEAQARRLGITRPQVARALQSAFDGTIAGVYRERDELLPIKARAPASERETMDNIRDLQIWSYAANQMIPMRQVLTGYETTNEDANIWRFNRVTTMRVHADPRSDVLPSDLMELVKVPIEQALGADLDSYFGSPWPEGKEHLPTTIAIQELDQIPLQDRPGYFMAWGGEDEDGARAQASLAASIPVFTGLMVLTVVFLFNAVRQPLVIWLTVPLAVIGVVGGLLLFNQPFGFMALLGALSLSGMLIKNSIVLIDEIDTQIRGGKEHSQAVVDSGVSRMRPVMMAAATTILGMIPLLTDAFFVAMAVTIMAGLFVATILTLVIVPVLYAIFFRIPAPVQGGTS
jgi:multidrug efflux pump subunit AcrB